MSDETIISIVTAVLALIGTIFSGVITYLMARVKTQNAEAAVKADIVADRLVEATATTDSKLNEIVKTGDAVHTLVNSNMAAALKISAVALRRVAELTKHPDDNKAAEIAESAYAEHEKKQEVVDKALKAASDDGPAMTVTQIINPLLPPKAS